MKMARRQISLQLILLDVSIPSICRSARGFCNYWSQDFASSGAVSEKGFIAPNVKKGVHNVFIDDNCA